MSFIPPNTYDGLVEKALSWAVKICNIPKDDEQLLNLLNRLISFSLAETKENNEKKSGMVNQRIFPSNFLFSYRAVLSKWGLRFCRYFWWKVYYNVRDREEAAAAAHLCLFGHFSYLSPFEGTKWMSKKVIKPWIVKENGKFEGFSLTSKIFL